MSMKRFALIAAVSSHHSSQTTTTTISTPIRVVATPPWAAAPTRIPTITDDSNLNLNAAGLGASGSAAGVSVSEFSGIGKVDKSAGGFEDGGARFFAEDVNGGGGLYQGHQAMRPGATLHGNVNVLLGGAMLSVVITVVCVVCYCCHRNIKKRSESIYRQQRWIDSAGPNMEVYSVEQCYEAARLYAESPETTSATIHLSSAVHSGPPPSYDSVLAMDEFIGRPSPPPKYRQPIRKFDRKCCTIARQTALPLNTCNISNCRKHRHQQHHSVPEALRTCGSCSCLQRQMHQSDQNSHTNPESQNDVSPNKNVPTSADSINNNVTTSSGGTLQTIKPLYECHTCQLCGKLQQYPNATAQHLRTTTEADVENGNSESATTLCSCNTLETIFDTGNPNENDNGNERLVHPEDNKVQVDSMNNEVTSTSCAPQSTLEFEQDSNLNQTNPHHQHRHGNHQQQSHHTEHQQPEPQHQPLQTQNLSALDTFNENGIIRMDMSQIIDRTGLPTYEAAIKLESSGYV
ncbi:uncharacterized protein LOC119648231 [Hermetia illucens]|uniref:uncharacterized protein LOC119648231 n=1 Tax=Hermetia illucens TaxID=343691 RepID=UPI0018CC0C27|nr:uncharacterized protein LOC119648231 [Hermetia illucens]XP_037905792.1 uncharacterized protein LOC119648231 [Hermetia illucens]XP_037905799.1 uncharacterized protein LOC119648231 [Hermetia illucens]XP_037905808.1 uncharacterized protein LOC119648231 [Hermetia illucens]XP_037905817.1 uncharacterized protein LOC119648231 [Hermetia illucens]XP_037905826.1 uncharacterized protein LOC119648231 [Hermetia illucens]XP_037905835.1 uncharacterized protein LOC119648231 [Hermetia illucens]XP_03790584